MKVIDAHTEKKAISKNQKETIFKKISELNKASMKFKNKEEKH